MEEKSGERMESLLFHLVVIPGVFLLGRLSRSVTITGFRLKKRTMQRDHAKAKSFSKWS